LVADAFEQFEEEFTSRLLLYYGKLLPLNYCFGDWLVVKLRPITQKMSSLYTLNSDYLVSRLVIFNEPSNLINLLQFLGFVKYYNFKTSLLGNTSFMFI
jgi:hypothetical protein